MYIRISSFYKDTSHLGLGFPGGSDSKNLPAVQETWVQSLGREDPLEKEMAFHSSILAWKIPLTEEPDELQSMGSQRVRHNFRFHLRLGAHSLQY